MENTNQLISVIIPTRHRNDDLGRCLDRLAPDQQQGASVIGPTRPVPAGVREQFANYEVIVTDDGTEDSAESMMREQYPWARWIAGPRRGPAANRNHGAAQAAGNWLVFLDDDCRPESGLIGAYHASAWGAHPVLEGRISPEGQRTRLDMECPVNETGGFLWSCNFAIRRDVFDAIEGFDAAFPGAAMEDVDLHTRLKKRGVGIAFVREAGVGHPWRQRKGIRHVRLHAASVAHFVSKHPGMRARFGVGPVAYGTLRRFLIQMPRAIWSCRCRGLGREVGLSIYAAFAVVAAVRRARVGPSTTHGKTVPRPSERSKSPS